jgi:SNF2 family DNA or RNA helicase
VKYAPKTRPYKHQVAGIKKAMHQFKQGLGVAFLFEPRTGKTKTTIDTLSILHKMKGLRRVVVIAPNRVLDTWVEQFHIHCPYIVQTIVWDSKARQQPLPTQLGPYAMQVLIVNYEAFGQPGRKTASGRRSKANGRFKHRQLILRWLGGDDAACVVDEGHKLKAPQGKASTMIVSMRPMFRYRFLLTGTPQTKAKRAHDLFMQWQWVNPDRFASWGSTVEDFKNHTGRWISQNGFPQWTSARPAGMEDLRRGMHKDGLVILRENCLDLPARNPDRIIKVKLGPSAKHYREMAQDMVTKIKDGVVAEASIPLVVTLRLSQITSGFVGVQETRVVRGKPKLVSVPHRVGFEKLNALEELLKEEVIDRDEKVVIAARFVSDLNAIQTLCEALGIPHWSIRGGMSREASSESLRAFRAHDDAGAIIIQPAAASLGIDLSTASHMIWFSLVSSWTDYTQACDRIALSPVATTHTYLLAEGTVDELMYASLQEDTNVARFIMTNPDVILPH